MSRPISIFVCLLLLANLSLAWWDVGHMTVAQIAELYLIENGKVDAFNKFNQLILAFKGRTDGKTDTFVEAAVWPDDIKNYKKDANSEEQDYVRYFDSYHYTDLTYDPHFLMASMKQKEKDVNSINIIGSAVTVLKNNKEKVTFERAFMARYLLHLAGDMHQPLHSTAMFNQTYPDGDLGGNFIKINTVNNGEMNLHAFMDSMAGEQKPGVMPERPLTPDGKQYIRGLARAIMGQYPERKLPNSKDLNHHTWTVESYNAAVEHLYSFVKDHKDTTPEWEAQMYELCRLRVALGGYRLAHTIEEIYG